MKSIKRKFWGIFLLRISHSVEKLIHLLKKQLKFLSLAAIKNLFK